MDVPTLTDAAVVFGETKHLPQYEAIPDEFKRSNNPYARAVSSWFFNGARIEGGDLIIGKQRFRPKEGVDGALARRAIRSVIGSFKPKHEHKEAGCAFMLSEWFDLIDQPSQAA